MKNLYMHLIRDAALAVVAMIAIATGRPAEAATLKFDLTGDYTASWVMDSDPLPDGLSNNPQGYTYLLGVPGVAPLTLTFYTDYLYRGEPGGRGGLRFSTDPDPATEVGATVDLGGDQIAHGNMYSPRFWTGVYNLTFDYLTQAAPVSPTTLTVTLLNPAPIPPALPLFASALAGLGFVGWRRRKKAR